MNIMIVLAHPDPKSFCSALAEEIRTGAESLAGNSVHFHNLDAENFDPVLSKNEMLRQMPIDLPARDYVIEIQNSDYLFLVFPDWWGAEPALLKGFLDRTLRENVAYARGELGSHGKNSQSDGLLSRLKLRILITSDTEESRCEALRINYTTRFSNIIASYCGIEDTELHLLSPVREASFKTRKSWLADARNMGMSAGSTQT